jgi:hypothetical protein
VTTNFEPLTEPASAKSLRQVLADREASDFWSRDDLTYLGDLSWCRQPTNGHEYITDWSEKDGAFAYTYGLINLDANGELAGGMVIPVRGPLDGSGRFEMHVGEAWLEGPLKMWLDQLLPEVQQLAFDRYRGVIDWVGRQLGSGG